MSCELRFARALKTAVRGGGGPWVLQASRSPDNRSCTPSPGSRCCGHLDASGNKKTMSGRAGFGGVELSVNEGTLFFKEPSRNPCKWREGVHRAPEKEKAVSANCVCRSHASPPVSRLSEVLICMWISYSQTHPYSSQQVPQGPQLLNWVRAGLGALHLG